MNDKMRITIGLLVVGSVIATLSLYMATDKSIDLMELACIIIVPLMLVFGAFYMFWRKAKSMRSGLPMEDEFSKKVNYRAGYYAYMVSIYVALAVMYLELPVNQAGAIVILVPAVVFMSSHIYLERKGEVG
jgi:uncharacterized membrane protein YidH (DUF202 family)